MTDVRAKLAELGLTLPVAAKPVAGLCEAAHAVRYGQRLVVTGVGVLLHDLVRVAGDVDSAFDHARSEAIGVDFNSRHTEPLARIGAARRVQRKRVAVVVC